MIFKAVRKGSLFCVGGRFLRASVDAFSAFGKLILFNNPHQRRVKHIL
jgi:hypothetical protein